jgi:hypothetical protein
MRFIIISNSVCHILLVLSIFIEQCQEKSNAKSWDFSWHKRYKIKNETYINII